MQVQGQESYTTLADSIDLLGKKIEVVKREGDLNPDEKSLDMLMYLLDETHFDTIKYHINEEETHFVYDVKAKAGDFLCKSLKDKIQLIKNKKTQNSAEEYEEIKELMQKFEIINNNFLLDQKESNFLDEAIVQIKPFENNLV